MAAPTRRTSRKSKALRASGTGSSPRLRRRRSRSSEKSPKRRGMRSLSDRRRTPGRAGFSGSVRLAVKASSPSPRASTLPPNENPGSSRDFRKASAELQSQTQGEAPGQAAPSPKGAAHVPNVARPPPRRFAAFAALRPPTATSQARRDVLRVHAPTIERARDGAARKTPAARGVSACSTSSRTRTGRTARREPRQLGPHSRRVPARAPLPRRLVPPRLPERQVAPRERRGHAPRVRVPQLPPRRLSATPGPPRTGSSTRCSTRSGSARTRRRAAEITQRVNERCQ